MGGKVKTEKNEFFGEKNVCQILIKFGTVECFCILKPNSKLNFENSYHKRRQREGKVESQKVTIKKRLPDLDEILNCVLL